MHAFLLGLVAGARSLTPLAAISDAASRNMLPRRSRLGTLLGHPAVSAGLKLLAVGELLGDKMKSAPDRIVAPGMAARIVTGVIAGLTVAPRGRRGQAAVLGAAGAVGAAYLTFHARMWALRRYGQTSTGIIEDILVVLATQKVMAEVEAGRGRWR
jgi:uncharacterized membrane protein